MKKGKLLIPMLFMCMVLTAVPAMKSNAEDAEGGADIFRDSG